jgi:hypothetical protein
LSLDRSTVFGATRTAPGPFCTSFAPNA